MAGLDMLSTGKVNTPIDSHIATLINCYTAWFRQTNETAQQANITDTIQETKQPIKTKNKTKTCSKCECIATRGRPTPRQSYSALSATSMQSLMSVKLSVPDS